MQKQAAEIYEKRKQDFSLKLAEARRKLSNLSQLRLLIFLPAAFLAGYSIYTNRVEYALYALVSTLAFIILVIHYRSILKTTAYLENMVKINQDKAICDVVNFFK